MGVSGAKLPENLQDYMLNIDPCKNEQQADFEVNLENRITDT